MIAIRHAGRDLLDNNRAGEFDLGDEYVKKVIETLKRRCRQADSQRAGETAAHIDRLVDQWYTKARHCQEEKRQLHYQAPDSDKVAERLLCNHGDQIKGLWPTLQSMRNIENSALLKPLCAKRPS